MEDPNYVVICTEDNNGDGDITGNFLTNNKKT